MYILHIALQGCLRGSHIEYGITADTGGHIKYLIELVSASSQDASIERIDIVTRAFDGDYSPDYAVSLEALDSKTHIVRFKTPCAGYLAKEDLWTELPSFVESLDQYISSLDRKPDIVHAHYADAGEVAAAIKQRWDIPMVFTAHSLGRMKWHVWEENATPPDPAALEALRRRIRFEERALTAANLIVASSRDEAETQYADYHGYEPGKVRVIAPGSDLKAFQKAARLAHVDRTINQFLIEPEKPPLLAIARPVRKKNLAALVTAYGESPALQEKANLIIIAGNRDDIGTLEPEIADNLKDILYLIDKYDLYGKVAYPKHHSPDDVPALYAYARDRKGVFVNPALNEPFGLTLLEASAAGLPLIATRSGGPNDIIERCHNGILVDPRSSAAISAAALELLSNEMRWQRYARGGSHAVKAYNWQTHVAQYHGLLRRLCSAAIEPPAQAHLGSTDHARVSPTAYFRR